MTQNERDFLVALREITIKYGVVIGGCGCCGSPFMSELVRTSQDDSGSGYADTRYGIKWISPADSYDWKTHSAGVVLPAEEARPRVTPTEAAHLRAVTIPGDVVAWLIRNERGVSSNTIVEHLYRCGALGSNRPSHPHDPSDLRRCMLLLESCPSVRARFDEMRTASPVWARLVDAWPLLSEMMNSGRVETAHAMLLQTIDAEDKIVWPERQ